MDDDEFERLLEQRRREKGINPEITLLDLESGKVMTFGCDDPVAKRQLAYGAAIETVPTNPDYAEKWLADLRERVVVEWTDKQAKLNAKYLDCEQPMPVFEDYEAWCAANGERALPAEVNTVVRWMLARTVEGHMEPSQAPRWGAVVADFHHFTKHPPLNLARKAITSYERALSFAKIRLRGEMHNIHAIPQAAPAKALDMFPDGVVPWRYHEIAA